MAGHALRRGRARGTRRAIQADLAAAFPTLPLYGGSIDVFVPHVTIVEGGAADDPAVDADPGWDELPVSVAVGEVELIVRSGAARWHVERRIPDAGADARAQERRRPSRGSSPRSASRTSA